MTNTATAKTYRIAYVPETITLTVPVEKFERMIVTDGVNLCLSHQGGERMMVGYGANILFGGRGEMVGTYFKVRQLRRLGLELVEV